MLVADHFAVLWKAMLLMFTIGVILMWFSTTASTMHEGDGPEFFTLLLGATLGMCLMAATTNLLMIFMAVEMASLPSYVLAGFRKTQSHRRRSVAQICPLRRGHQRDHGLWPVDPLRPVRHAAASTSYRSAIAITGLATSSARRIARRRARSGRR